MTTRLPIRPETAMPERTPLARRWWHELPMWLFYVPVGIAVIGLSLRHLSPLAALRANPGLEKGGLFPGSKQDFFALFPETSALLPASVKLEAGWDAGQLDSAWKLFCGHVGSIPQKFVVKPDDGIQGKDIQFLQSIDALQAFWNSDARGSDDWLLQEYVDGLEATLFYNQPSPQARGQILSMALKWGYPVTGDGRHTIAQLIELAEADHATKRQVAKTNRHRLDAIPPDGEPLDLIEVRNHHLGATFQDASAYITPTLEAAVCSQLDAIDGYQYGRLDVRAPDFEALRKGRGIKVLEANALYSEPVHAYDPKYGLRDAYRIFIGHWHQAIKTGLANRRAGRK